LYIDRSILAHADDDRYVETSIQIRQAQGAFPSAFGAAVLLLVEMLEDEETIESGATGKIVFDDMSTNIGLFVHR
jgi:hypothetical protein